MTLKVRGHVFPNAGDDIDQSGLCNFSRLRWPVSGAPRERVGRKSGLRARLSHRELRGASPKRRKSIMPELRVANLTVCTVEGIRIACSKVLALPVALNSQQPNPALERTRAGGPSSVDLRFVPARAAQLRR